MFVNDLFKLKENSNEEYYAVYDQRGKPMIMRKPVGKTAEAYAEEKNYRIKGGPFGSHQETESFWIRSVLHNKKQNVDEAHGPLGKLKPSDIEKIKKAKEREKKTAPGQLRRALPPSKQHYRDSSIEYFAKLDEQHIDTEQNSDGNPVAEAIPYALSAANAAAEYQRQGLAEGGFDIPEIPRAPQPRPEPKNKSVGEDASKYMDTKPSSVTAKQADELGAMARKAFRPDLNPDYYKDNEPVRTRRNWDYSDPDVQPIVKQWMDKNLIDRKPMTYQQGDADIDEGSVQDKLHSRHQEIRKKRGAPDPEYYRELKNTFDLPDEERFAKAAELKKKYKVTNEDREQYIEELGRAGYEIVTESATLCPECGGTAYADRMLAEKQDACYHKVKSRYKVWPSAYASGALVRCRKVGAANWGNKSKK